jgi:hypothetical protein
VNKCLFAPNKGKKNIENQYLIFSAVGIVEPYVVTPSSIESLGSPTIASSRPAPQQQRLAANAVSDCSESLKHRGVDDVLDLAIDS